MKRFALVLLLAVCAPAQAADLMVVGRDGTLLEPRKASVKRARIAGCRVPGRTPLAALARTSLDVAVRDYASCAPSGLYVRAIDGLREKGRDGWVYKLGNRAPSQGSGEQRFSRRSRVLWFWCRSGSSGCQRTLAVKPARTGDTVRVTVRAYDDYGRGIAAGGATVTLGSGSATADSDGVATLPFAAGRVVATQAGRVRSFGVTP